MDDLLWLASVWALDQFEWSAAYYAAHSLAVGKYELSAFVADLCLYLKVCVLRG